MFDLVAQSDATKPILAAASALLCQDALAFARNGGDAIFANRAGQILCCTQALAAWGALGEARPRQVVVAGYSVGELAAWGCAGALEAGATLKVAATRAELMDRAAPPASGMAGIIGLTRDALTPLLATHQVQLAIVNDADSFVVGGGGAALDALCHDATAAGAVRAVRLHVAVPSHTPFLAAAVEPIATALRQAEPRGPKFGTRLLSGIDGDTVFDVEAGIQKLARQTATTINWAACLDSCHAAGATRALELGPGNALSRMAERVFGGDRVRSVDDFRTIDGIRAWLFHDDG